MPEHTTLPVSLYRNRDYLLMVGAGTISALGSKLSQMALPFLALALTQSPLWAGLLAAAQTLPYLLFSLPAGAWVDQVDRKRLLIGCDLLRAGLLLSIVLAYALASLHMLHLFVVIFIAGLCTLLFEIADMAALPQVVDAAQLGQARSISEGIEATANVLGPSLGGLLIGLGRSTLSGSLLAYCVDSLSYMLSALALLGVRRPLQTVGKVPEWERGKQEEQKAGQGQLQNNPVHQRNILSGMNFIWRHATLRMLMLLTSVVNFLQAPTALFVILIAQQRFGLAAAQIGLLFGLAGAAALLGSFLAAWLYRSERLYVILHIALLVWSLSALTMAFATHVIVLGVGLALTQAIWPLYAVAVVSYRLAITPDHLQGRVISSFRMLSYGAEPLGLALGGFAVSFVSPALLFGAIGVTLLLCVGWVRSRE